MTVRRRALVAAAAAMLAARMPAGGDQLADALRAGNAATEAAATLRSEIDALSKGAGDPRTDARIALRRVAFDLLFRGDAAEHGDASVVAGFRLAWLRAELDALVQSVPADAARAAALAGAVAEFANAAAHGVDRVPPPDRPEESLRALLEPLDRAVAATEADGRDPGTAWPAAIGRGNRPPAASAAWIEPAPAASMPADDAARIAAIQGWSATIRSCSPRSAAQFEASAKAWSTALRDRVRQAAARAALALWQRTADSAPYEIGKQWLALRFEAARHYGLIAGESWLVYSGRMLADDPGFLELIELRSSARIACTSRLAGASCARGREGPAPALGEAGVSVCMRREG